MSERSDLKSANGTAVPYRRQYVRVAVSMPVSYAIEHEDTWTVGHSSDLGGGGVRLATSQDLPLGTVLTLRLALPGTSRELTVRGRIVLSFFNAEHKQFFHGIAFTQIDPRDQAEIINYVNAEVHRLAFQSESATE